MSQPIVSDAGPLISFARAGRLELLRDVVQRLVVPDAVYDEVVVQGAGRPGADEVAGAAWVERRSTGDASFPDSLPGTLGAGEREAMGLCIELGACLLADDAAARREARLRGIPLISSLDVMDMAKTQLRIRAVRPVLDGFVRSGFRLKRTLYDAKLRHAGESP